MPNRYQETARGKMSQVFFISDTHFGHRNICKYRPFKTPKEHDDFIITRWNDTVRKKNKIVWVLGDMFIKNKLYDMSKILGKLNGTIKVIMGNHCEKSYYTYEMIQLSIISKYGFWLSHAPIHPLELRGKRNIHGHVHNKTIPDDRYINVCCENVDYKPISLDRIRNCGGGK